MAAQISDILGGGGAAVQSGEVQDHEDEGVAGALGPFALEREEVVEEAFVGNDGEIVGLIAAGSGEPVRRGEDAKVH